MKASMAADGTITISPESGAEAFALQRWVDVSIIPVDDTLRCEKQHWRSAYLHIDTNPPKDSA